MPSAWALLHAVAQPYSAFAPTLGGCVGVGQRGSAPLWRVMMGISVSVGNQRREMKRLGPN